MHFCIRLCHCAADVDVRVGIKTGKYVVYSVRRGFAAELFISLFPAFTRSRCSNTNTKEVNVAADTSV